MKNSISCICSLAALLIFFSCKKEPEPAPALTHWGEATALLNGEAWSASPNLVSVFDRDDRFYLTLEKFNDAGYLRNALSIKFIPFEVGRHTVFTDDIQQGVPIDYDKILSVFATRLSDGDIYGSLYDLLETDSIEDFVEITKIDPVTREVWGNFQASFGVLPDRFDFSLPDTLVFKSGEFHTKVLK